MQEKKHVSDTLQLTEIISLSHVLIAAAEAEMCPATAKVLSFPQGCFSAYLWHVEKG